MNKIPSQIWALSPKHPYDSSMEVDTTMYDHMPYKRDYDICNGKTIRLVSGNIIKYFRCVEQNTFEVKNHDNEVKAKLAKLNQDNQKDIVSDASSTETTTEKIPEVLSEEQLEQLLKA